MFIEPSLKPVRANCEKSGFPPIYRVWLHNLALMFSGTATHISLLYILPESLRRGKCACVCVVCV